MERDLPLPKTGYSTDYGFVKGPAKLGVAQFPIGRAVSRDRSWRLIRTKHPSG